MINYMVLGQYKSLEGVTADIKWLRPEEDIKKVNRIKRWFSGKRGKKGKQSLTIGTFNLQNEETKETGMQA